MAQSIVSCPECGRKYRIGEGSKPGQFQCTNCGAAVAYGDGIADAPIAQPAGVAKARPVGGGGRGPARRRPGARRRGAGRRPPPRGRDQGYDDYEDEGYRGYRRESGPNPALYVLLGVAAVVVLGVLAYFVLSQDDGGPPPVVNAGNTNTGNASQTYIPPVNPGPNNPAPGNTGGGNLGPSPKEPEPGIDLGPRPAPGGGNEGPDLGPSREPAEPVKRAEDAPEGGLYGQSRMDLRGMDYGKLTGEIDHLDSTSSDLRREIDKLCETIVDIDAGAEAHEARSRLMEIGRAAVPRVVSAFSDVGSLDDMDGIVNACYVHDTLTEICGPVVDGTRMKPMARPDKGYVQKVIRKWFVWWYSKGYELAEFEKPQDDPEEEEDE